LQLLKKMIHPDLASTEGRTFPRTTARGIILQGENILLMYTKHYNDYSFPGGGVDSKENLLEGLKRELMEETGAQNIQVLEPFGYIDEYRPHYKPEYDLVHMESYFYRCTASDEFLEPTLEDYEKNNGMQALWVNIFDALDHNRRVIENKEASMGFSILRETFVLEEIAKKYFPDKVNESA